MQMTSSEWILLTDADVHFAPDALRTAMGLCVQDKLDFLTAIPDVLAQSPLLHVVITRSFHQASLFFDPRRINDPTQPALLRSGSIYAASEVHLPPFRRPQWLKMEVIDDTGFALLMRRAGAKMAAVAGINKIQIEWYPSFRSFMRGIEKNSFAFSQYSVRVLLLFTAAVLTVFLGFTLAPALTKSPAFIAFSLTCLAIYLFSVRAQMRRIFHLRP